MGKTRRSERGTANKLTPSPSKKARRARNLAGKLIQKRKLRRIYRHNGPEAAQQYAIKHGISFKI